MFFFSFFLKISLEKPSFKISVAFKVITSADIYYSFNNYLLKATVPSTVTDPGDTTVNKMGQILAPMGLILCGGRDIVNQSFE